MTARYRLGGEDFALPAHLVELEVFSRAGSHEMLPLPLPNFEPLRTIARSHYSVSGTERDIEAWQSSTGMVIQIARALDFHIANAPTGEIQITRKAEDSQHPQPFNNLQKEALLGPVLVLALAEKETWSLHAGAVMRHNQVITFLGESGMGKSTLSAYLSKQIGWQHVADDILPVKEANGLQCLPRFPQLKLKAEEQPANALPESLPLRALCLLEHAEADAEPELRRMSAAQTVQSILRHTAGTRMFGAELLAKHLQFAAQAAGQVAGYTLTYPHRREALPQVKEILENLC